MAAHTELGTIPVLSHQAISCLGINANRTIIFQITGQLDRGRHARSVALALGWCWRSGMYQQHQHLKAGNCFPLYARIRHTQPVFHDCHRHERHWDGTTVVVELSGNHRNCVLIKGIRVIKLVTPPGESVEETVHLRNICLIERTNGYVCMVTCVMCHNFSVGLWKKSDRGRDVTILNVKAFLPRTVYWQSLLCPAPILIGWLINKTSYKLEEHGNAHVNVSAPVLWVDASKTNSNTGAFKLFCHVLSTIIDRLQKVVGVAFDTEAQIRWAKREAINSSRSTSTSTFLSIFFITRFWKNIIFKE